KGGGGALNSAIALKRLGVDSYPMGEIGHDYAGDVLLNIMDADSIDTSYIMQKRSKATSVVNVIIRPDGERSFACNPGNYIKIKYDEYDWDILEEFDVLLIGSCFLLDGLLPDLPKVLQKCREHNTISIIDTVWPNNLNFKQIIDSLPYLDYFTPSFKEAQLLTGKLKADDIAQWCLDKGTKNVLVKMDKEGCYLANNELKIQVPALTVPLVDSTGAGDCFLAGFIRGLLSGYDIVEATKLGNAAGAMCVQFLGAYTGISNFNDLVNNFYAKY
ncbi:MAG: carbohydrate kinase family protein, partial [Vampirovibrionia bacterium]